MVDRFRDSNNLRISNKRTKKLYLKKLKSLKEVVRKLKWEGQKGI